MTAMKTIATTVAINLLKGREERYPAEEDMADSPLEEGRLPARLLSKSPKPIHAIRNKLSD